MVGRTAEHGKEKTLITDATCSEGAPHDDQHCREKGGLAA